MYKSTRIFFLRFILFFPSDFFPSAPRGHMECPSVLRIFRTGKRFLIFDVGHIWTLRTRHRIVGALVGALPSHKRQAAEHGAPLVLHFEEALLALEEGIAEIVDAAHLPSSASEHCMDTTVPPAKAPAASEDGNSCLRIEASRADWLTCELPRLLARDLRAAEKARVHHAEVFRQLWVRGFYVTSGATYGADYLCYAGDPICFHAHILVILIPPGQRLGPAELLCVARLASSTKKQPVLACSGDESQVQFLAPDARASPAEASSWDAWTRWDSLDSWPRPMPVAE